MSEIGKKLPTLEYVEDNFAALTHMHDDYMTQADTLSIIKYNDSTTNLFNFDEYEGYSTIHYYANDCLNLNYIMAKRADGSIAPILMNTFGGNVGKIMFDGEITTMDGSDFQNALVSTSGNNIAVYAIKFPDTITDIESLRGLDSVRFIVPLNTKTIPHDIFQGKINISDVVFNAVETIEQYAFYGCKLILLHLPDTVTTIGERAFGSCVYLKTIRIPGSVQTIGTYAFNNCNRLENVILEEGIKTIGINAFSGCASIETLTIPSSVTSIGNYAFFGLTSLKTLNIGNGVNSGNMVIGEWAFGSCRSIKNLTISNCVKTIGSSAFRSCSGLTNVTIPSSVTGIEPYAFQECTALTSITIPNSVKSIGSSVFFSCSSLKSVIIPNSVTTISSNMFYNCSGLTSITIPSSVTSIGDSICYGCKNLTGITIPNSVKTIGTSAFSGCTSITSVTIPSSVTSIGNYAFYGTTMSVIHMRSSTPCTIYSNTFQTSVQKIYVPTSSVNAYKTASVWSNFASKIVGE